MGSTDLSRENEKQIEVLENEMATIKRKTGQTEFLTTAETQSEKIKLKYDISTWEDKLQQEAYITEQNNMKEITLHLADNAKNVKKYYYAFAMLTAVFTGIKFGVLDLFIQ